MLPRVSYLEAREMLVKQKEAILAKIRQVSRSHIVHRGRDVFPDDSVTQADPNTVPGLSRSACMAAYGAHVLDRGRRLESSTGRAITETAKRTSVHDHAKAVDRSTSASFCLAVYEAGKQRRGAGLL